MLIEKLCIGSIDPNLINITDKIKFNIAMRNMYLCECGLTRRKLRLGTYRENDLLLTSISRLNGLNVIFY